MRFFCTKFQASIILNYNTILYFIKLRDSFSLINILKYQNQNVNK